MRTDLPRVIPQVTCPLRWAFTSKEAYSQKAVVTRRQWIPLVTILLPLETMSLLAVLASLLTPGPHLTCAAESPGERAFTSPYPQQPLVLPPGKV